MQSPTWLHGCGASHLLTCLQYEIVVDTPVRIKPDLHVRLHVDDISQPIARIRRAQRAAHDETASTSRMAWGGRGPNGHSLLGRHQPLHGSGFDLALRLESGCARTIDRQRLREASPTAYPNRLMIRLADAALGRKGRMIAAVESMGRGVVAREARPFSLAADFSGLPEI